jgi:hypothetical protein
MDVPIRAASRLGREIPRGDRAFHATRSMNSRRRMGLTS